ncbi:MAG: GNAT family N-acetyltransferase [Phycisphaerae bacterium]|nr:GNAT family N-acetyltransferase [Phycisphaerae bacterium]
MDRHKTELLHRTFSAGLRPFVREMGMLVKSKLCGATHLVFEIKKQEYTPLCGGPNDSLSLRAYDTWDAIPEEMKGTIARDLHGEYWGKQEWIQIGWRFWVGTIEQELAIVGWTRGPGRCEDFFFPLSSDCGLLWQTVTVPKFRGRGLCSLVLSRMSGALFENGVDRVYGSCRDYNLSSKRAIEKAGFKYIGRGFVQKRTGKGIWYPVARPFTEG